MIIPQVTSCFSDKKIENEKIDMRSVNKFPLRIKHCINYALDLFGDNFTESIIDFQNFLNNNNLFL